MAISKPIKTTAMRPEEVEQEFMFPVEGVTVTAKSREEAEEKVRAMQEKNNEV